MFDIVIFVHRYEQDKAYLEAVLICVG